MTVCEPEQAAEQNYAISTFPWYISFLCSMMVNTRFLRPDLCTPSWRAQCTRKCSTGPFLQTPNTHSSLKPVQPVARAAKMQIGTRWSYMLLRRSWPKLQLREASWRVPRPKLSLVHWRSSTQSEIQRRVGLTLWRAATATEWLLLGKRRRDLPPWWRWDRWKQLRSRCR